MKFRNQRRIAILGGILLFSSPLLAQEPSRPGRVADTAVGEMGQRQTRAQAWPDPMTRINNRIPNRVQNRIRNRIDRHYDPQANTTSPFETAADQAQATGSRTRR